MPIELELERRTTARDVAQAPELVAEPGAGQFVKRAKFGEELAPVGKEAALA